MMRRATTLLLGLLAAARADTLILNNGMKVTGTWLGIDATQMKFQVNDQIQVYPRSDLFSVTFGDPAPQPPPVPAPPPPPAPVAAQPVAGGVPEPEKIGAIYLYDPTGKLIPLERIQAVQKGRVPLRRGAPVLVPIEQWEMAGGRSPVRMKTGQELRFVVKLANGIDPDSLSLYPLETKKTNRLTKLNSRRTASLRILFDVQKFGESSYLLKPVVELGAGEYAFGPASSNDAYCFGVDQASASAGPVSKARVALLNPGYGYETTQLIDVKPGPISSEPRFPDEQRFYSDAEIDSRRKFAAARVFDAQRVLADRRKGCRSRQVADQLMDLTQGIGSWSDSGFSATLVKLLTVSQTVRRIS